MMLDADCVMTPVDHVDTVALAKLRKTPVDTRTKAGTGMHAPELQPMHYQLEVIDKMVHLKLPDGEHKAELALKFVFYVHAEDWGPRAKVQQDLWKPQFQHVTTDRERLLIMRIMFRSLTAQQPTFCRMKQRLLTDCMNS